jgi:4-amino-4-deoxy-L-arabinose transferase-like glycosyltransferase
VGFLGAALAAVTPHLLAHSKVAGLEAPSGFFFVLGVWFFFRGLQKDGNSGWHLGAGLALGLVTSTRVTNLSLGIVMLLAYLYAYRREIRTERRFPMPVTLGLLPVVAAAVFFGLWPYLWSNPLQHLGEMLSHWKPDAILEFFLGKQQEPSLLYFPLYFAVTMPVGLLAAFLLGAARLPAKLDLGRVTLLLWFLAPFVVALSPMARDGVRYLYPALAPACLIAAFGVDGLGAVVARLLRRPAVQAGLCAALGTGLGLYTVYSALSVHPYYLDYYNEAVGGTEKVERKRWFEVAWWGEGIREACAFVNRNARQDARVQIVVNPRHLVELRPDLHWAEDQKVDFIIYNRMFNEPLRAPGFQIAHVVRAGKAPLVWVYERERER